VVNFWGGAAAHRVVLGYHALDAAMRAAELNPWHLEADIAAAHRLALHRNAL